MSEQSRYEAIRDGVLNHMAHHRGQLTVYLRLNDEKVPAIYGPSADEGKGWKVAHRTATQIARFAVKRNRLRRTQTPVAASDRNIP